MSLYLKVMSISASGDPVRVLQGNGESAADAFAVNSATLKRGQIPTAANGKGVSRKGSMHHRIFGSGSNPNGKVSVSTLCSILSL